MVATKLAAGVLLMGGGSHNSLAVEFKDYVTVIEGPLNEERSNAVIAEVKKIFPNKPIRYLVNTHNHFDHLGGVRTYVAEGATVITDARNTNFYPGRPRAAAAVAPARPAVARPFAPTGPGDLALQTFTDQYTISDGNETIELYHVDGLNHSDNMLVAYLPKEKILVNADLYSPPAAGGNVAECQRQRGRAVQEHQAAEARRGAARADPRQSGTERRFRADRRPGSGKDAASRVTAADTHGIGGILPKLPKSARARRIASPVSATKAHIIRNSKSLTGPFPAYASDGLYELTDKGVGDSLPAEPPGSRDGPCEFRHSKE